MINPIQQNVVFHGVKKNEAKDNFKGVPNVTPNLSVRQQYLNTVNDVNAVQNKMTKLNEGQKLDVLA